MSHRAEVESISEVVMHLVRPVTEVGILVEGWWTIVVSNLALNSCIHFKISCTCVDLLHEVLRHGFPEDDESISLPRYELLLGKVDHCWWGVGRGRVGRAYVSVAVGEGEEEEEGTDEKQ